MQDLSITWEKGEGKEEKRKGIKDCTRCENGSGG